VKKDQDQLGLIKHAPAAHPAIRSGRIGVLLVNLGTPEATDRASIRCYLKEFLSDRRVIETNPVLWWFILNGIILNTRPKKSGHAYDKIWNRDLNESPLKTITRSQAARTAEAMSELPKLEFDWGMRYGKPSVGEQLKELKDRGCDRILIFPLYPQYSAATTASVMDAVGDALISMRWQPAIRTVPPYYDHPAYIDALAESLSAHLKSLAWTPDLILASFHGLPQEYFDKGDPYHCHCQKTARLLGERLGLPREKLRVVFQSRFGRAEWIKPYAQDTIEALPGEGVNKLVVIMPGFATDCVETLEEVAIGLKETFKEKGGTEFSAVPCLNDSPPSIAMLKTLIYQELQGWL
jgi:protoporphyrin/coproporphyrin ferrochelatase